MTDVTSLTIRGCLDLFSPEQVDARTWVVLPPIFGADGDSLPIFMTRSETGWRLSDRGAVAAELANDGQRYWDGSRAEIMRAVAVEGGATITEDWEITRELDSEPNPVVLLEFLRVLIRAGDVGFLDRRQVRRTFREDLQRGVVERVRGEQVEIGFIDPRDRDGVFKVDVLLRPPERPPVVVEAAWDNSSAGNATAVIAAMRSFHPEWKLVFADGGLGKKRASQLSFLADARWDAVELGRLDHNLAAEGLTLR